MQSHYIYSVGKRGGMSRSEKPESPIEDLLWGAAIARPLWERRAENALHSGQGLFITAQYQVGPFYADFMVTQRYYVSAGIPPKAIMKQLAVECDGHDWHERTKQQIQNDKRRDRYFNTCGIPVLRFTGSEIYKDADKCVAEIERVSNALMGELLKARNA